MISKRIINAVGNIHQVVSHTFQIGQHIGQNEAHFDGAFALLQTIDVALTQLFLQIVNHFFQRLDQLGCLIIIGRVSFHRKGQNVRNRCGNYFQFLLGGIREVDAFGADLLTGLGNGYDLTCAGERPVLIGGGVGVPPLYLLAKELLKQLFIYYMNHLDELPEEYRMLREMHGDSDERVVCDYIAGMSDGYAIDTYERLFVPRNWQVWTVM